MWLLEGCLDMIWSKKIGDIRLILIVTITLVANLWS